MNLDFEYHGQHLKGEVQLVNGKLWVNLNGKTFTFEDKEKVRTKTKNRSGSLGGQILAPMPGKVTKLLIEKGQVVKAHTPIVVMEAMKMEYTLKTEVEGEVETLHHKVGDQVPLGALLISIKVKEEKNESSNS